MNHPHLLFVYNADAGLFSSAVDFVHKMVSPATYSCSLCQLTYGNFTRKQEWKDFLNDLPATKTFLHRNEFVKQYNSGVALPAVFYLEENNPELLLSATEINTCHSLPELQVILQQKMAVLCS